MSVMKVGSEVLVGGEIVHKNQDGGWTVRVNLGDEEKHYGHFNDNELVSVDAHNQAFEAMRSALEDVRTWWNAYCPSHVSQGAASANVYAKVKAALKLTEVQ